MPEMVTACGSMPGPEMDDDGVLVVDLVVIWCGSRLGQREDALRCDYIVGEVENQVGGLDGVVVGLAGVRCNI